MNLGKIKVSHIITSLTAGGAQVLLYELLKRAHRSLYEMEVICLGDRGKIAAKIEALPCKITYLNSNKLFPGISFFRLLNHLKQSNPEVVHCWLYHANLMGGLAAKLAHIKTIILSVHHGAISDLKLTTRVIVKIGGILSKTLPTKIVYTADQAQAIHQQYGFHHSASKVIYNGVDSAQFKPDHKLRHIMRAKLGFSEQHFVIGMLARFNPNKGFYLLLQAFSKLDLPNARLVLAGYKVDHANSELKRWIEEFDLTEKISLLGEINSVETLPAFDLVVLCSLKSETTPLCLLEAMSCEIPVIATDVGDCKAMVDGAGYCVSPGDGNELSLALAYMATLSTEERLSMAKQGRANVQDRYELITTLKAYNDLYQTKKTMLFVGSSVFTLLHFRLQLMQAFKSAGYRVIACAPVEAPGLVIQLNQAGIEFEPINLRHTSISPFANVQSFLSLRRIIKKYQPETMLSYTLKPIIFGSYLAKRYGVNQISSMLTGLGYVYSGQSFKQRSLQVLLNYLLKRAFAINQMVFFQNPDDAKYFTDKHLLDANKVKVVNGSGVNIEEYTPQEYPSACHFILIARLLYEKGIVEYVQAAQRLKLRYPSAKFYLVGKRHISPSSILQAELEQWIQSGVIEYLGELSDVKPAIANSSVFVLPSFYREGTPRAILEAMAMARPIITTDMPGCRETVQNGINGYLVPAKNPEALAKAMQRFLDDPKLIHKMGQASRRQAEQKYDVRLVNQVMLKALDKLQA